VKTAIYIEDGVMQLVITPENKFEKDAVGTLCDKPLGVQIFTGAFYDCRGGWTRQSDYMLNNYGSSDDKSIILRVVNQRNEIGELDNP
jgi:hypothetical protein